MVKNVTCIQIRIITNVGASVKIEKTPCMLERLYLEPCYM